MISHFAGQSLYMVILLGLDVRLFMWLRRSSEGARDDHADDEAVDV